MPVYSNPVQLRGSRQGEGEWGSDRSHHLEPSRRRRLRAPEAMGRRALGTLDQNVASAARERPKGSRGGLKAVGEYVSKINS